MTLIGSQSFHSCRGLEEIIIPRGVTSIGKDAFGWDEKLTIYAPAGSYAKQYAKRNQIDYTEDTEE